MTRGGNGLGSCAGKCGLDAFAGSLLCHRCASSIAWRAWANSPTVEPDGTIDVTKFRVRRGAK